MNGDPSNRGPIPGRRRLPRTAILRGQDPFRRLFQGGRTLRSPGVDFKFRWAEAGPPGAKVAFIAGKRLGGAVVRNRVKRLMREAFRLVAPLLEERLQGRSLEGAFIAKTADLKHQELMRVMANFFAAPGLSQ